MPKTRSSHKHTNMKRSHLILLVAVSAFSASCSSLKSGLSFLPGVKAEPKKSTYEKFTEKEEYPKSYTAFKDEELLKQATSSNTSIQVDLSDQRVHLLVGDEVALDAPCCTGRSEKKTPTGSFKLMEKIKDKRSNIYGTTYNGSTRVHGGDRRKYNGPSTRFVGSSLPYWMRVTGDGIGFHYSKNVKRYPASGGCIRLPMDTVTTIYSKVKRGTPVTIQP